jgi:hypothetical protein
MWRIIIITNVYACDPPNNYNMACLFIGLHLQIGFSVISMRTYFTKLRSPLHALLNTKTIVNQIVQIKYKSENWRHCHTM